MTVPVTDCTRCPALVKTRKRIINGEGPSDAKIVFVGEGPGQLEDERGRPFIGKAGRVLKVLQWAAGIDQRKVYFTNATRCWGQRNPTPKEVDSCHDYLIEELRELNPTVIVSLGGPALRSLYRPNVNVSDVMGFTVYNDELPGIPIVPTYHPSYLIMRGNWGEAALVLAHFRKVKRIADNGGIEEKLGSYMGITTLDELHALRDYLLGPDVEIVSLDTETTGLSWMDSELLCISFSGEPGVGFSVPILHRGERTKMVMKGRGKNRKEVPEQEFIPVPFWSEKEFPDVLAILGDILGSDKPKAGQNIEFDIRMLERRRDEPACTVETAFGFSINNVRYDTRVLSSLLFESLPANLTVLNARWTNIPYYEEKTAGKKSRMWEVADEDLWEYGAADADVVSTIAPQLYKAVEQEGVDWVRDNISMPLLYCANRLEERGVQIDMEYFDRLCSYYRDRLAEEKQRLDDTVGRHVEHPTHWQHVQKLVFEDLGLPLTHWAIDSAIKGPKRCKKCEQDNPCSAEHAATGADALGELNQRSPHPVLPVLIDIRHLEKFSSTYLDGGSEGGFRRHIRADGRIHGRWNAGRAATGRFTCITPEMRVLTEDLRWVDAGKIQEGDWLLAFDEYNTKGRTTGGRRQKRAQVVSIQRFEQDTYRVRTPRGSLDCSGDHRWLVRGFRDVYRWATTEELMKWQPRNVLWITSPWSLLENRDAGYLAGLADGEGTLHQNDKAPSKGKALGVTVLTNTNEHVIEECRKALERRGFSFSLKRYSRKNPAHQDITVIYLTGGLWKQRQFLGSVRPPRLLSQHDASLPHRLLGEAVPVLSIESLGTREVVALQTTSGTYIAEGFAAHNCEEPNLMNPPKEVKIDAPEYGLHSDDAIRSMFIAAEGNLVLNADWSQLEVWGLAYETGDPTLLDLLMSGRDVHVYVARKLCQHGVSRLFPHEDWEQELSDDEWKVRHPDLRGKAKTFTFGLSYQLTEKGAADRLGCTLEEAHGLFVAFLTQIFPTLPDYFARIQDEILRTYSVRNKFGRRRHFPEVPILGALRYRTDLEAVIRQGVNYPIQSGGHDLHSLAHIHTEAYLAPEGILPVLEIHDSLALEVPEARAEEAARRVKEEWENLARNVMLPNGEQLGWEVPVEVAWGPSLGNLPYHLT